MGSKAARAARVVVSARCVTVVGCFGLVLSCHALRSSLQQPAAAPPWASVEHVALLVAAGTSLWSSLAALRPGWLSAAPMALPTRAPAACQSSYLAPETVLPLLRSFLSGGAVALLGWSMLLGEARHLALMLVMQASSMAGAWLACEMQRTDVRKQTASPTPCGDKGMQRSESAPAVSAHGRSLTLPRGWRYHRSSGLFEHKRTGRVQYEPPGTTETGSPLCNLPPCDEERALLECGSDGCSDRDSGAESRRARSRTWHESSRRESSHRRSSAAPSQHAPMSVWELRRALSSPQMMGSDGGALAGAPSCRAAASSRHAERDHAV